MRGKQWSIDDERLLRRLVEEGKRIDVIAQTMGKTIISVRAKFYNLGLTVKDTATAGQKIASVSSLSSPPSVDIPPPANIPDAGGEVVADLKSTGPLPSVEEKLRVLNAALVALEQPGLRPAEISRLHKIVQDVKVYEEIFVKFVNYSELETLVVELRQVIAELKKQNVDLKKQNEELSKENVELRRQLDFERSKK